MASQAGVKLPPGRTDVPKNQAGATFSDPLQDQNFGEEMGSLPFTAIIGGAFKAVVDAQQQASITTINFIQSVGFKPSQDKSQSNFGDPIMVEFVYQKQGGNFMERSAAAASRVRVPFLTLIPIPHLRVETMNISFIVKLTQTREANLNGTYNSTVTAQSNSETDSTSEATPQTSKTTSSTTNTGSSGGQLTVTNGFREGISKNSSWSQSSSLVGIIQNQSYNTQGLSVTREYSIKIDIQAVQDKMPAGMERIVDILVGLIGPKSQRSSGSGAAATRVSG